MHTIWKKFRGMGLAVGMLLLSTAVEPAAVAAAEPMAQSAAVSTPQDDSAVVASNPANAMSSLGVYYVSEPVVVAEMLEPPVMLMAVGPSMPADHRAMRGVYYAHDRLANLKVRYMFSRTDSRPPAHSYL